MPIVNANTTAMSSNEYFQFFFIADTSFCFQVLCLPFHCRLSAFFTNCKNNGNHQDTYCR